VGPWNFQRKIKKNRILPNSFDFVGKIKVEENQKQNKLEKSEYGTSYMTFIPYF
jgi:hypothetical protein